MKEEKVRKYKFTLEYDCFGTEDSGEGIASHLLGILETRLHAKGRIQIVPWNVEDCE